MGNIIRLLTSRSEEIKDDFDIFVDFESNLLIPLLLSYSFCDIFRHWLAPFLSDCQPSSEEYDLWLEINEKLAHAPDILLLVHNYLGASIQIRAAIERYSDEVAQEAAWHALTPLVHQLRICYDFGVYLGAFNFF